MCSKFLRCGTTKACFISSCVQCRTNERMCAGELMFLRAEELQKTNQGKNIYFCQRRVTKSRATQRSGAAALTGWLLTSGVSSRSCWKICLSKSSFCSSAAAPQQASSILRATWKHCRAAGDERTVLPIRFKLLQPWRRFSWFTAFFFFSFLFCGSVCHGSKFCTFLFETIEVFIYLYLKPIQYYSN